MDCVVDTELELEKERVAPKGNAVIQYKLLQSSEALLNQVMLAWFLSVRMSVCMCVPAPEAINIYSGLMWCDIDPMGLVK